MSPDVFESPSLEARLVSHGWLPWGSAVELLSATDATWVGTNGVNECSGNWPTQMPLTTRIHAWSRGGTRMWRLIPRHLDQTVLVTSLDTDTSDGGDRCQETTALPASAHCVARDSWERWYVEGASPVMFLRREDPR